MVLPSYQSDWATGADWATPQREGTGWWKSNFPAPFSYEQRPSSFGQAEYAPWSGGLAYAPMNSMTYRLMQERWDQWLMETHPELFQFEQSGRLGAYGTGEVGQVARPGPGEFGDFWRTPEVFDEIQAAANKYGVPANFLLAILAKESSGRWAQNSQPVMHRGQRIHGYIGVYEDAARSWGFDFDRGIGNRAYQIEILAGGLRMWYDRLKSQDPNYDWLNVAAVHYSGDPTGATTPGDSWQHGSTQHYMNETLEFWTMLDNMVGQNTRGFDPGPVVPGTALGQPQAEAWQPINRWDQTIMQAASQYGVPPNLIKAIMRTENPGGDPSLSSPQGATGLMQIMPSWNGTQGLSIYNPTENILLGAYILQQNYQRYGSWENAAKAYLAGNPYSTATDYYGTGVSDYWRRVSGYWAELDAASSGLYGGPAGNPGPMLEINAIWGGGPINETQGFAAYGGPDLYEYGKGYGLDGSQHTGLDVGMPRGSTLYSATGGTVEYVGPERGFKTYVGNSMAESDAIWRPDSGAVWVRLDNGHQIIYGHMDRITVRAGDRVTPGQVIGASGAMNGDHLHLEYRVPDESMPMGWRIVDPVAALSGQFVGSFGTGLNPTDPTAARPMTYSDMMRRAAMGQALPAGQAMSSGSGWHDWIRGAMFGNAMSWDMTRPAGRPYRPIAPGSYIAPDPVNVGPTPF